MKLSKVIRKVEKLKMRIPTETALEEVISEVSRITRVERDGAAVNVYLDESDLPGDGIGLSYYPPTRNWDIIPGDDRLLGLTFEDPEEWGAKVSELKELWGLVERMNGFQGPYMWPHEYAIGAWRAVEGALERANAGYARYLATQEVTK